MKTLFKFLLALSFVTGVAHAAGLRANSAVCADSFHVVYSVQLKGQTFWLKPDEDFQLSLPAAHTASAGATSLGLELTRSSQNYLEAQFSLSILDAGIKSSATPGDVLSRREMLIVRIEMDSLVPKAYAGHILHSETGSLWGISLIPVCTPSQLT